MTKATFKKESIVGLLVVSEAHSFILMAESLVLDRGDPRGIASSSSTRRGWGRRRGERETETNRLGLVWALETSKPISSATLYLTMLRLFQEDHKCMNLWGSLICKPLQLSFLKIIIKYQRQYLN